MLNFILLFTQLINFSIQGTLVDGSTQEPIQGAAITLTEQNLVCYSDSLGRFELKNIAPGKYTLEVSAIGYAPSKESIEISSANLTLNYSLLPQTKVSEEIIVTAIRADNQTPVTQYNLSEKEIKAKYFGHDIPTLLTNAPSVNNYSETGNGIGYSYFRLRGIDQTRLNLTINGIPVNDPETQGYYFNNFADIATSLKSIQIQRGVGTSTNGAAAFGGAVNMTSKDLTEKPSFAFSSGYGSFVSRRLSAEFQTGTINNKFAFYGKVSNVGTDGYRDNSSANVNSYFVSGAYFGKKSLLKINSFGGQANSTLAYIATDKSILDTNRTYNPLGSNNKDRFRQSFHQIQYTYELNKKLNLSSSAYFVKGDGYFDLTFPGYGYAYLNLPDVSPTVTATDVLASYKLNQYFYGAMAYLNYTTSKLKLNIGLHGNQFSSDHSMEVKWAQQLPAGYGPNHEAYFNTGYKNELSAFAKIQYSVSEKFLLFADAQVRSANFRYKGKDKEIFRDTFSVEKMNWVFFNPKLGMRYSISKATSLYVSGGKTTREPTRIDYLGDDRANFNVKQSDVKPETIYNIEAGTDIRTSKLQLHANLFLMEFRNEIAATGELNYFGYAIRKNVGQSFRRGIEIDWTWQLHPKFSLLHASAYSYNQIKSYTQNLPVYDSVGNNTYTTSPLLIKNATPVLTPSLLINQGFRFSPLSWISIDLMGKYVSKMYLDNTNNETLTTPSFFFADARIAIKLNSLIKNGDHLLSFQINNITNAKYATSGTPNNFYTLSSGKLTQSAYPSFYPSATRNFFVTLTMKF